MKSQAWTLAVAVGAASLVACGAQTGQLAENDDVQYQQESQQQDALMSGSRGDLSWLQYHHLDVLARGWQARYEMAQLALQNSSNTYVQGVAQDVINAAPSWQQQLLTVACNHGAELDVRPSFKDEIHKLNVRYRTGDAFDQSYGDIEEEEFTDLADEATRYSGGDDDVSAAAAAQICIFQQFAAKAQWLRDNL